VLVSAYVFLTGYGNTVSLGSKPPTLAKYAASFLRINLLVTFVSLAMGQPWMLYYICGLHTFWTAYVYVLHATTGGGAGGVSRVPKVWRYLLAIGVNTLLWHWPTLFYAAFSPLTPLLTYDGSLYEVRTNGGEGAGGG
jgi:N-acetylneuraminate 9-O-acetyltransferase